MEELLTHAPHSERVVSEPAPVPPLTVLARALGLIGLEAASVGLAGWELRSGDRLYAYVVSNALSPSARVFVFLNMGVAILVAAAACAVVLVRQRERGVVTLERFGRRAAPLILTGALPLLFDYPLWIGRDLTFLALAALFAWSLPRLVTMSLEPPPRLVWPQVRLPSWLPLLVVGLAALGYTIYFSVHTIANHYRLGTAAFDLGVENNLVWNAAHLAPLFKTSPLGGPQAAHLGFHQTYLSYLLAIPYRLVPRPESLLVIQALFMGGAAVPLYLLARRRVSPWLACLVAVAFTFYPPLHGANLYDFHYLPFAPLFLWTTLYLIEERRDRWAILAVILSLSVREDISALMMLLGLYLLLRGERPRAGLVLMVVGAVYFVAIKMTLMPHFLAGKSSYVEQYKALLPEGGKGYGGILQTVFGNPAFTLTSLLTQEKLLYVLLIATPLAFIPWRRPVGWLCSVPGFFFTLLATGYHPLLQISFQYTAYWTTFVFLALVVTLAEEARPAARRGLAVGLAGAMLVMSYQYGAVLQTSTARGGFSPFRFGITAEDRQRHDDLYALIGQVPPRAKIVSSEMIVPQVSSRPDAYTLRTGLFDAEYLLIATPLFGDEVPNAVEAFRNGQFGLLEIRGEFVLARRGAPATRNAEALRKLGK
jgi:uncharacterized membrane protein